MTSLRLGVLQTRTGIDPAANAASLVAGIADLAAQGARIVFTPEMSGLLDRDRSRLNGQAATPDDDFVLAAVRAAAAEHKVWVQLGSLALKPAADADRLANRAFLIADDGRIVASYDKLHLFDVDLPNGDRYRESAAYAGGERAVVAATPWGRIGLSICYDMRFPPLYAALAHAGAGLIAVPAAFTRPTGAAHWHVLLRARAIETGAFVVAAAQTGVHEDGRETWGHSLVVDPWGTVLLDMGDEPGGAVCDIDLGLVASTRARIPSLTAAREFTVTIVDDEVRAARRVIVFDLRCGGDHVFEAWFGSTADYDAQQARGLVDCPICGDGEVTKAVMAPAVPAKGNRTSPLSPVEAKAMLSALAAAQAKVEADCDYVGTRFAAEARAIHDGEAPARGIVGEATRADALALAADGIAVAPLPFRSKRTPSDA